MRAFAIPAPLDVPTFTRGTRPHYRQSPMLHINRITLSVLLASCIITRDFTSVSVYTVPIFIFFPVGQTLPYCESTSLSIFKAYIELYRSSHSLVFFFPFEPIELHYRLISNRSLPSFSLGLAPTMTL